MIERIRGELRARLPEVTVSEPTTLKAIGIHTSNDKFGFANELMILARIKKFYSQDIVYLGLLAGHPLLGQHLAQILNHRAPHGEFGGFAKRGIIADFEMPGSAENERKKRGRFGYEGYNIRLDRIHKNDPKIGSTYQEFVDQNLTQWKEALENNDFDSVFFELPFMNFRNEKNLIPRLFSRYSNEKSLLRYGNNRAIAACRVLGIPLYDGVLDLRKRDQQIMTSLKELPEEKKQEFVLRVVGDQGWQTLVDLRSKKVWQFRSTQHTEIDFVGDSAIRISDTKGTSIQVEAEKDQRGKFDWRISQYEFPPEFTDKGLYPLFAWKKNGNGERTFLAQNEISTQLAKCEFPRPEQADVMLGRVMAAYFSQDVINKNKWEKEMPLKHGRYIQEMMGAQMPVWVSLPDHAKQLLSDENGFFPKLEAVANFPQ